MEIGNGAQGIKKLLLSGERGAEKGRTKHMKEHIGQNVRILIMGLCLVLLLTAAVLSAIPEKQTGILVEQTVEASASRISMAEEKYACELQGILKNGSEESITVESLEILVSDGKNEHTETLDGFTLPPRVTKEIFLRWETEHAFDRVLSVTVHVNGEANAIPNVTDGRSINGITWLLLGLSLLIAYLLYRACMIRYYMYQEDRQKTQA